MEDKKMIISNDGRKSEIIIRDKKKAIREITDLVNGGCMNATNDKQGHKK